jgi:hypothetical protein
MAAEKPRRSKSRRGQGPVRLAVGVEHRLAAYASAAAAAGVSLAAMATSAEAKIIYTPASTPINGYVSLDVNHDGIPDILIRKLNYGNGTSLSPGCALHTTFRGAPPKGVACNYLTDQIWGRGVARRFASALPAGFKVRPSKSYFQAAGYPFQAIMGAWGFKDGCSTYPCSETAGQWLDTKNRYLGLQFVINGQVHYGWARLTVTFPPQPSRGILAILTGYAYETEPNKPIITGKTKGPDVITLDPATLGHLAGGASQIPAWRGERNRAGASDDSRRTAGQGSQAAP